jgi:hypothetical protein
MCSFKSSQSLARAVEDLLKYSNTLDRQGFDSAATHTELSKLTVLLS